MSHALSDSRILITGGSGFIGTNAVEHFLRCGAEVSSVDVVSPKNRDHFGVFSSLNLLDQPAVRAHISKFDPTFVIHLGARTDLRGETWRSYRANTVGVENLINALRDCAVERVIFASSRLVCEIGYQPTNEFDVCPDTTYGESKVAGERLVRHKTSAGFAWTIVRPTSIWGPWFGVPYRTFFDTVAAGRYVHPGNLAIKKTFGFVGNSVFQIERLLTASRDLVDGKTLYLGDAPPIDVLELASIVAAKTGRQPIRQIPLALLRTIARVGDVGQRLTGREMPLTTFRLDNLLTEMVYNLDELQEIVGSSPYTVEEGVNITLEWIKNG